MNRESDRDDQQATDPVAAIFAAGRESITELPPADEDWEQLLGRSRRPRRWPAYLGGAAAAAVVAAVALAALPGQPEPLLPEATRDSQLQQDRAPALDPTPSPEQPQTADQPVPAGFVMTSISTTRDGGLKALGRASCDGQPCSAVVSSDDGRRWTTRAVFRDLPLVEDADESDAPALTGIRFASDDVGYVFGTTMRWTADGGRTWEPFDYGKGRVLSVETDQARVWIAVAQNCSRQSCTGPVTVHTTGVGATGLLGSAREPALTREVGDVDAASSWVALDGSTAYLNVFADGTPPQVVGGQPLARPDDCRAERTMTVVPTATTPGTLFAICATAPRDSGNGGFAVAASTNGGRDWEIRSDDDAALGPVRHGGPWVVATDAEHLVAATGGTVNASGGVSEPSALVHSDDAGRTWQPSTTASGGDLNGNAWGWVGAAGGQVVYAIGTGGGYRSTDGGATFEPIDVY